MKKNYFKPAMSVVEFMCESNILVGSPTPPSRSASNAGIDEDIKSDAGSDGIIR